LIPLPAGVLIFTQSDIAWCATALGAPDEWHESLRSTLGLCLDSAFPIAIYWGQELNLLYNDAWRPILGDKASVGLGRPAGGRQAARTCAAR
jgi:hypothetical protein